MKNYLVLLRGESPEYDDGDTYMYVKCHTIKQINEQLIIIDGAEISFDDDIRIVKIKEQML